MLPSNLKARAEVMNARQTAGVMVGKANEGREAEAGLVPVDDIAPKVQNCFLSISHRHATTLDETTF